MASEIDAAPGSSITSPSSSPTSLTLPSMLALSSATSPTLMDLTNGTSLSLSSSSLLLRTSSAPIKMTNETTQPESVTPPLTSEAGITQVSDAPPSDSLNDVNQPNSVAPTAQLQRTSSLEFQNTSTPMVNNTSQTVLSPSNQLQISAPENDNPTTISLDIGTQASEKFVPSLGSWAKPLVFKPLATPSEPCTPHDYDPAIVGNQLAALWPSLNDEILNKKPKSKFPTRAENASSPAQTSIKEIEGLHSTLETIHASPPTSVPSDTTVDHLAAGSTLIASAPSSLPIQQENLAATLGPVNTLSTLVDQQSTPITTLIMESSPSSIINTEARKTLVVDPLTTSSNACAFESPSRFTLLGDVDEVVTEPSSSLSLTRGGREIKLPTKYQDMDWKTVRGRGKRGRRGHGSYH
ncbi:unnamed protein product [Brassica napus]|uniref:(rape) hypothetical protein n=1 Tax=Brassica napus TaxID=3708 RepID=A0A816ICJ2_BRANA|nr:unnamed protein product [Brassica napus]